jgi:hypothetical protein
MGRAAPPNCCHAARAIRRAAAISRVRAVPHTSSRLNPRACAQRVITSSTVPCGVCASFADRRRAAVCDGSPPSSSATLVQFEHCAVKRMATGLVGYEPTELKAELDVETARSRLRTDVRRVARPRAIDGIFSDSSAYGISMQVTHESQRRLTAVDLGRRSVREYVTQRLGIRSSRAAVYPLCHADVKWL